MSTAAGGRASAPARLWVIGAVLVLSCLVTAALSAQTGWARTSATSDERTRLDYDTAELYQALRGADASVTEATGIGARTRSPTARARYGVYIASAYLRLDNAKELLGPDAPGAGEIEQIVYELPRYTAGVDTAQAVRDDDPAAARTDLAAASLLMSQRILPTADTLQRGQHAALTTAYQQAGGFPVAPVLAGLVTLAALVLVSVREARRTRRILNAGLVPAALLTVLALAWWLTAAFGAAGSLDATDRHDTTVTGLTALRDAMLDARSTETASLVSTAPAGRPGTARQLADDFDRVLRPGGLLDAARSTAGTTTGQRGPDFDVVRGAVAGWRNAVNDHGAGSDESRAGFVRLTTTMTSAIDAARGQRTSAADDAAGWFTGLTVGPALLMVLAAACSGLGIGIRLREYPGTPRALVPRSLQRA